MNERYCPLLGQMCDPTACSFGVVGVSYSPKCAITLLGECAALVSGEIKRERELKRCRAAFREELT